MASTREFTALHLSLSTSFLQYLKATHRRCNLLLELSAAVSDSDDHASTRPLNRTMRLFCMEKLGRR